MGKPWEDYKDKIEDYYIKQNLPLKVVQQRLLQEDGFEAWYAALISIFQPSPLLLVFPLS